MALTGRLALWTARQSLRGKMQEGERLLAVCTESGRNGDVWVVSSNATYVDSKPTRASRDRQGERHLRIPHGKVEAVRLTQGQNDVTLTVTAPSDGVSYEYSGCFAPKEVTQLSRLLSESTGVEGLWS